MTIINKKREDIALIDRIEVNILKRDRLHE